MNKLISKESFKIEKVRVCVEETENKKVFLSGYAIRDLRNGDLVSMNDEYFHCAKTKRNADLCVRDGLFEGFTHYTEV